MRGTLLAALLVASQACAWLHAAVVSHITCLEHGESIHARALVSLDARPPARAPAAAASPVLRADASVREGHEHCGSDALLRWRGVALAAPVTIAQLPAVAPSRPFDSSRGRMAGAAVYLVAPKTSPPPTGA